MTTTVCICRAIWIWSHSWRDAETKTIYWSTFHTLYPSRFLSLSIPSFHSAKTWMCCGWMHTHRRDISSPGSANNKIMCTLYVRKFQHRCQVYLQHASEGGNEREKERKNSGEQTKIVVLTCYHNHVKCEHIILLTIKYYPAQNNNKIRIHGVAGAGAYAPSLHGIAEAAVRYCRRRCYNSIYSNDTRKVNGWYCAASCSVWILYFIRKLERGDLPSTQIRNGNIVVCEQDGVCALQNHRLFSVSLASIQLRIDFSVLSLPPFERFIFDAVLGRFSARHQRQCECVGTEIARQMNSNSFARAMRRPRTSISSEGADF